MRWLQRAWNVARVAFGRRRLDREIDAELRFHLEQQIEENLAAGMPPDAARASAMRSFGPMPAIREDCRDSIRASAFDEFGQDVRYCWRTLRRNPGFTVVAVLSLAAGIAVNTTVLTVAYRVLLEPLPYRHADRLVRVSEYHAGVQAVVSQPMLGNVTFASNVIAARISMQAGPNTPQRWMNVADGVLDRIRAIPGVESAGAASMAPLGDSAQIVGFRLSGNQGEPIIAYGRGYVVTPGYAETLSLRLLQGRLLNEADVSSATEAMVVNEQFVSLYLTDGKPVVGRRYAGLLGPNTTQEIVGVVGNVLKEGFSDKPQAEFYVALGNQGATGTGREMHLVMRTARDPASLIADLRSIVHDVDPNAPIYHVTKLSSDLSATAGEPRFAAILFAAFAALAVCLAAVGLSGVLAYSVLQRRRELGVRTALGATRGGLMLLVVTEGMGLTAMGIVAGLVTAAAGATLLRAVVFGIDVHDAVSFAAGPMILAVVALSACALPAWRASSLDPLDALRSE
jgi:predicted permease